MSGAAWLAARSWRTSGLRRSCRPRVHGAGGLRHRRLAVALCVVCLGLGLSAAEAAAQQEGNNQAPPADAANAELPRLAIRRARLDNGLRVVLQRDTSLPTVAICVSYDVGVRNEDSDQRGFARLLEGLMFRGSKNVAPDEHARWIREHGGQYSAQTSSDRTQFVDLLPSNALGLGLWLEADRMKHLEISLAAVQRQRAILRVQAERYHRDSRSLAEHELRGLVFRDFPGYAEHPLAGSAEPGAATPVVPGALLPGAAGELESLRDFYRRFYAANNAVLTVVGNFELLEALNLIHIHFADARSARLPPAPGGEPPEQAEPRSALLEGPLALWQGWAIPARRTPDHYALELARVILGGGVTARLPQALMVERALAHAVTVWTDQQRGPDLFAVHAALVPGTDPQLVRRTIESQIAALGRFGPSALELSRAQQQLRTQRLLELDGKRGRAVALSDAELFSHDARLLDTDLDRYQQISREDVQHAVARYLRTAVRSSVLVRPHPP